MTHNPAVDLTTCDREPIQIPGAVQPHGVLLVLSASDLTVLQVTQNAKAIIGVEVDALIGKSLSAIFDPVDVGVLQAALDEQVVGEKPNYLATLRGPLNQFDVIAHRLPNRIVLELEPTDAPRASGASRYDGSTLYRATQHAIARMQSAKSLRAMYQECAERVRAINGFDRVMVYRFDRHWNGEVIAEDHRVDLEPFLGLHYPASDIPQQARELYRRNMLRFIADCDYIPARLFPANDPETNEPLDMSLSVLRSVSPIHLEYLSNMGVNASMSISLIKDGQLWGLVACHHYSPRRVPFDVRSACELLGHVMSLQLTTREDTELTERNDEMRLVRQTLANRLQQAESIEEALLGGDITILDQISARGAAIVIGDEVRRIGQTPGDVDLLHLSHWLNDQSVEEYYATDFLAEQVHRGTLSSVAAGFLAISIGRGRRFHIMWFRPEQVRTVHWAGDPTKSFTKGPEGVRLSPRGSFALWKETVMGHSEDWSRDEIAAAMHLRSDVSSFLINRAERLAKEHDTLKQVGAEREQQLTSERNAREMAERVNRMKDDFVATLSHELRTPLNAILGYAYLLRREEGLSDDVTESIDVIERNARVQSQMIEDLLDVSRITSGKLRLDIQPVNLTSAVEAAIDTITPAARAKGIEVRKMLDPLIGVDITGDTNRLQQIFWNLLSNAIKFTPKGGKVHIVLERVNSHVEISVADSGQGIAKEFLPFVFERFRQEDAASNRKHGGLGLGLSIVRHLVELHGGTVNVDSAGLDKGTTFTVSLPIRILKRRKSEDVEKHPTVALQKWDCETTDLEGVRVLVLDDEPDARELVKRILEDCKVKVTAAANVADAIAIAEANTFDVVISDIGMAGEDGYTMITKLRQTDDRLTRQRTPAVALTAYATADDRRRILMAGYQMHVSKPVEPAELIAVVASLANRV